MWTSLGRHYFVHHIHVCGAAHFLVILQLISQWFMCVFHTWQGPEGLFQWTYEPFALFSGVPTHLVPSCQKFPSQYAAQTGIAEAPDGHPPALCSQDSEEILFHVLLWTLPNPEKLYGTMKVILFTHLVSIWATCWPSLDFIPLIFNLGGHIGWEEIGDQSLVPLCLNSTLLLGFWWRKKWQVQGRQWKAVGQVRASQGGLLCLHSWASLRLGYPHTSAPPVHWKPDIHGLTTTSHPPTLSHLLSQLC